MPKQMASGGKKVGAPASSKDVRRGLAQMEDSKDSRWGREPSRPMNLVSSKKNYASGGAVRGNGVAQRGTNFKGHC